MGPLQLVSHVVQKHFAGEQETHCDKTKKSFKFFLSCPSAAFLAHQQSVFVPRDWLAAKVPTLASDSRDLLHIKSQQSTVIQ